MLNVMSRVVRSATSRMLPISEGLVLAHCRLLNLSQL